MKNSSYTRLGCITVVRLLVLLLFPITTIAQSDACTAPTPITAGLTCTPLTNQTLKSKLASTGLPGTSCIATNNSADVWYSFTPQSPFPTISLSNIQSSLRAAGVMIRIMSGTTCTTLAENGCGFNAAGSAATSLTYIPTVALTPGNPYYIRISTANNSAATSGTSATWNFDICVAEVPNDACENAVSLLSNPTCVTTAGQITYSSYSTIPPASLGCGIASRNDVWYTFTAETTNPTITLATAMANPRLQLFSGTCSSLTSVQCGTNTLAATGLTIGATYYIRVYTDPNVTGTFTICVVDPPINDVCSGAIALTPSSSCVTTGGTLVNATYTAIPTIGCGTPNINDVWYTFVPLTSTPTITVSAITNPQLQIYSGNCGALTPGVCGTGGVINATGLTPGATYYVRVYNNPSTATTFNICVTEAVNDDCANAILLTSGTTCVNTAGTLVNSTYTTIPPASLGCGIGSRNDVWYRFVAQSTNPTVTVSSAPANSRVQLFSGTCGTLTSLACGNGSVAATGLTIGTTYYVRVYTDPNASGTFNICIVDPAPPNDLCINAVVLTPSGNCVNTTGTLTGSTYATIATIGCGTTNRNDVWYSFVAVSTSPSITLTTSIANPRLQLFSGSCAGLTSVACGNGQINATGLTPGATYFVRVYTDPNVAGSFGICVVDPPNDECAGAVVLTANTACTTTPGNFLMTTPSAVAIAPCTGPVIYDVWYAFQAPAANATVTLGGLSASVVNPRMQLLSGTCGTLTSVTCGLGTTLSATGLTPGTYYYIRVYAAGGSVPATTALGAFTICVTYTPTVIAPPNDLCANAIVLPVNANCSKTLGTIVNANATATAPTCTGATNPDVWYRFVATSTQTTVGLGDAGANFTNRRIQVLTGTCAVMSQTICSGNNPGNTTFTTVIGTTYYIRVITINATAPTSLGDFSICVFNTPAATRSGNSYVNITKKTTGGVVEPGDILEIRMTISHTSGTITNLRYVDNVPTNTVMCTGPSDRIRTLTNEGIFFQSFTLNPGDDPATYLATPPSGEYQIRMNLAFGTTMNPTPADPPTDNSASENVSATGSVATGNIPNNFGSAIFATAFRVRVTGNVGDIITLNTPQFIFQPATGPEVTLTGTPYQILITSPMSLCANSTGVNMSQEFGGTFGTGATLNRPTDLAFPIPGYTFVNVSTFQGLNDGQYSIVKNMSPRSGTNQNAERSPTSIIPLPSQLAAANRMHGGHWDIDGDHTGTNNIAGNGPTAEGSTSGYMLMVNADYVASETYRQTLNNLCPNTYYEFSAWFRNICPTCGNDYTSTSGGNYSPRQPGVLPNLTFALDGLDRYNTGEIPYNYYNSVSGGWVKKGFVFVTGPTQTSATFSIRNNAQGGGGNDWAMDDITVATCLPNMSYSPSLNPVVCLGNSITLNDTITSYFNNYVHYKWQKSLTGGGPWTDIPGQSGSTTATPVTGGYRYITTYAVPLADAQLANNGDRYRVIVATTASNLSDVTCNVTDGVSIIDVNVMDCTPVLKTDLVSFSGRLSDDKGLLTWVSQNEESNIKYIVERSNDGINFQFAGTVNGTGTGSGQNHYNFIDPVLINGKAWYRLQLISADNKKKYSSTILLTNDLPDFDFLKVVNPFSHTLQFDVAVSENSMIHVSLIDIAGRTVRSQNQVVYAGTNSLNLSNTEALPAGVYTLKVTRNEKTITKKVVKTN